MYRRRTNLSNVGGRSNYVRNKSDIEEVVGYSDTATSDFWRLLARENQTQFLASSNANKGKAKAIEGREFVLGLPASAANQATAEKLAQQFKETMGLECMVGIHKKRTRDQYTGELTWNIHAHLIHAERLLLDKPIVIEERRAERTYYYDANGKKCRKADAVKVTPKGTITQVGCVRHFTDKLDFYDLEKSYAPFWEVYMREYDLERFDPERHFPQKKIGKNNPKEEFIIEYNKLVRRMNAFFDELDSKGSEAPAKETFCAEYSVPERFSAYQTDEIRAKFEAFRRDKEVSAEELLATLAKYEAAEPQIAKDVEKAEAVLDATAQTDFVKSRVAAAYRSELEEKYGVPVDNWLLAYLRKKLNEIRALIAAIREKLGFASAPKERGADERRPTKDEWTK